MSLFHCSENSVTFDTAINSFLTLDENGISLSILFSIFLGRK